MEKEGRISKAQVSVFVIIAIVLVVGIGAGYLAFRNTSSDNEFFQGAEIKPSIDSLKSSIMQCMETSARDSLNLIGVQGGYFDKPEKRIDLSTRFVPFYYYEGILVYPTKEKIESELSKSVNNKFSLCIEKIKVNDFVISHGKARTTTSINQDNVEFSVDMPISIRKEENTMTLQMRDSPISLNSALYNIIEVADYISESHKTDARMMCVSCIGKMAIERKLYVDFLDISTSSTLVIISENYTSSEPYSFEFLNKYKTLEPLTIKDSSVAPKAPINLGG